jgi:hypothetical protein
VTSFKSKEELLKTISTSVALIGTLHESELLQGPNPMLNRWRRPPVKALEMTYHGNDIEPFKQYALDSCS